MSLGGNANPVVLIIKKTRPVLEALDKWLTGLYPRDRAINDIPLLVIDDEADYASVNTSKPDKDPTITNELLRKLLKRFSQSCYIGYTATPFANIFINPDAESERGGYDLFPRDFIFSLDAPTSYFGPDKIFVDDPEPSRWLRVIDDCEDKIPLRHKYSFKVEGLPRSLLRAFDIFIIAAAIRLFRGPSTANSSMLAQVSTHPNIHSQVRKKLEKYGRDLKNLVCDAKADVQKAVESRLAALQYTFIEEFSGCDCIWSDARNALPRALKALKFYTINGQSDERLDYEDYKNKPLVAVAVGGNALSRGVTLDGLCASYLYRDTRAYDTLMQLGRWFGYRSGYEDLRRIWLTKDSIEWYRFIAAVTGDLREQIRQMQRASRTPREFGLYVETHPDKLRITAANKMRSAVMQDVKVGFSGQLREMYKLPKDRNAHKRNECLIGEFCAKNFAGSARDTGKGWIAEDVDWKKVYDFLGEFSLHPEMAETRDLLREYLKEISGSYPRCDVLLLSLQQEGREADPKNVIPGRRAVIEGNDYWETRHGRICGSDDEGNGMSEELRAKAAKLAKEDFEQSQSKSAEPVNRHFREVRGKPLLMLHILDLQRPGYERAPSFGMSFPYCDIGENIRIAANRVYEKYGQLNLDYEEDEDD